MMSSLYIGATGLKSHAEGMSVITNNLANVNTVAYKQMSMQYADLVSQFMTTSAGTTTNSSQVGAGSMPGSNRTLFTQGGFESGSAATDLAINGIGFFGVTHNGNTHYTRAGNFRFTAQGELLDPSGWNLLGHAIENGKEAAAVSPIKLNLGADGRGFMAAQPTTEISLGSRLGGIGNASDNTSNAFFAMAAKYSGTSSSPLGSEGYAYQDTVQFYNAKGELQSATVYYDSAGSQGGLTAVEYVVALNPSKDGSALAGTPAAGLLLAGTLTFSSSGDLENMTAFYPPASGDPSDLSAWTPATLADGQPVLNITSGNGQTQQITLDFGISLGSGVDAGGGLASAADAASNPSAIFNAATPVTLGKHATTSLGDSPGSYYSNKDGYAQGNLLSVDVTADGIIRGQYSNGQSEDLYRISLYRFTSQDGLHHDGNNHYSATQESGPAEEGVPGTENWGTLAEYSLEQSNVDYAREFSLLIVTQRGFQANSKIITTSDTMLQRALELKR